MSKAAKEIFLKDFPEVILPNSGAIFVGAGVSLSAGYSSWAKLCKAALAPKRGSRREDTIVRYSCGQACKSSVTFRW
jgi:hypothetical protein